MYSDSKSYTAFMTQFQAYQGIATIFFMLVGANILRRVSWLTAAIFTPMMMLITGFIFFALIFFGQNDTMLSLAAFVGTGPLGLAIVIGTAQNVLTKSVKYSLNLCRMDQCNETTFFVFYCTHYVQS